VEWLLMIGLPLFCVGMKRGSCFGERTLNKVSLFNRAF